MISQILANDIVKINNNYAINILKNKWTKWTNLIINNQVKSTKILLVCPIPW